MIFLKMFAFIILCAVFNPGDLITPEERFRVIKEWRYINFTWTNYDTMSAAVNGGDYIAENVFMAGINFHENYYYLSLPRMKHGVPITLGRIHVNSSARPLVEPFPNWEMNKLDDCDALQNVQNVAIDAHSRMWIIDGGKTITLSKNPNMKCDPKLVIFNLKTNVVEDKYIFPSNIASKEISFLYDLVIDDDFAYITDNSRIDPGLIVYSHKMNTSWKIKHDSMKAEPTANQFTINEMRINASINIAGIALGPKTHRNDKNITLNEDREIFYCPLSSLHLYAIRTSYLKDEKYTDNGKFLGYVRDVGVKGGQTDGMKMDNKGVLYFGILPTSSIVRWDSNTPFISEQKVIARDQKYIEWPNSFAFDDSGNILVLTNSLNKFVQGKMNVTESNFRILKAFVNGRSYVYSDDTLVYSVHETHGQGISTQEETASESHISTSSRSTTSWTTTGRVELQMKINDTDEVMMTKVVSNGTRLLAIFYLALCLVTFNLFI